MATKKALALYSGKIKELQSGDSLLGVMAYFKTAVPVTNPTGIQTSPLKVWMDIVSPNTGNGYVVDISSAGFTQILGYSIAATKPVTAAVNAPQASIKTITNTAATINIVEGVNFTLVGLGPTLQFVASTTGLIVALTVWGI